MDDVRIVIQRPRDPQLKALGWNTWKGTVICRHCGDAFEETVIGTRATAEGWNPYCPVCWELTETDEEIFWLAGGQPRGDE